MDKGDYKFADMKKHYLDEGIVVPERWVTFICLKLLELLSKDEILLILHSPITVCGDVHGQYEDVRELFKTAGIDDKDTNNFKNGKFLFMGDYVDRGYFSLNTFLLLAGLKLEYPDRYFLLRGNHESRQVTVQYGFYTEMQSNYGSLVLYNLVMDVFDALPYSAVIDNEIFATHGGLSPNMRYINLLLDEERHCEIPSAGILADLTWSDPDESIKQWRMNTRGAGYLFGNSQTKEFCHNNKIKFITRSHQLADDDIDGTLKNGEKPKNDKDCDEPAGYLLLVWSAPNYAYRSKNKATILDIKEGRYRLKQFNEAEKRIDLGDRNVSIPFFA